MSDAGRTVDLHGEPLVCRPGDVLQGYEVVGFVMSGGSCQIFEARHPMMPRRFAIKVEKERLRADATRRRRIVAEARALALLDHPNVLRILHAGIDERVGAFIVMDLLEGKDLRHHLIALAAGKRHMPIDVAVRVAMQLADALAAFHRVGVLHRDLKPENVFMVSAADGTRVAKLLDLGLAKHEGAVSEEGSMVGSLPYMAPEQLGGGRASQRSEVFALGIVLCEMLTGSHPFSQDRPFHEHPSVTAARVLAAPLPIVTARRHDVSPALARVVERALAREPEQRYTSMEDLRRELEQALQPTVDLDETVREAGAGGDTTEPLAALPYTGVPRSWHLAPPADLVPTVRLEANAPSEHQGPPSAATLVTAPLPPFACELGSDLVTPSLVLIEAPGVWRFMRIPILGASTSRRPREARLGFGTRIPMPDLPTLVVESDGHGHISVVGPVQRAGERLEPYEMFRCGPYLFQLVPPTPDGVGVPIDYLSKTVPERAALECPSLLVRAGALEAVGRKLPLTRRVSFLGGSVDIDVPLFGCQDRVAARLTVVEGTGDLEVAGVEGADVRLHGLFAGEGRLAQLDWFEVAGWVLVYLAGAN